MFHSEIFEIYVIQIIFLKMESKNTTILCPVFHYSTESNNERPGNQISYVPVRVKHKSVNGNVWNIWVVSVLPAINPFAFDQPVYSGDDVQLTCYVARGDEPIAVSWTLNGLPLDNSRPGVNLVNVGSKTSLLTMSNVNHNSDGEYRCLAKNPAGLSFYSANLTVYGKAGPPNPSHYTRSDQGTPRRPF